MIEIQNQHLSTLIASCQILAIPLGITRVYIPPRQPKDCFLVAVSSTLDGPIAQSLNPLTKSRWG